jgi:hypothetical protein
LGEIFANRKKKTAGAKTSSQKKEKDDPSNFQLSYIYLAISSYQLCYLQQNFAQLIN